MPAWTDIANGDIDQDSPGTQTLFTALRDNPLALAQFGDGAPVHWAFWHPYDMLNVGDGNDGVFWDANVDGALATIDTPLMEDGFEYAVLWRDVTSSGGNHQATIQRSTDSGYFTARTINSAFAAGSFVSGEIYVSRARETNVTHSLRFELAGNGPTIFDSGTTRIGLYGFQTTAYAVDRVRLTRTGGGSYSAGSMALYRRGVL